MTRKSDDYYKREMPFVVSQGRISLMRAAWLRNRKEFLELTSSRGSVMDLQVLFTFFEFLVPCVLDFLVVIRTAPPAVYERLLPYFMKCLSMLSMDYFQAFLYQMNDWIYLKKFRPVQYTTILNNANTALLTLDIEHQHRLLGGLVGNINARGWMKFNQFVGELPGFEQGESHFDHFEDYYNSHTPYAWRYHDTESDPKNDGAITLFAGALRALLTKVRDNPKKPTRVGSTVVSTVLMIYPVRLLGKEWMG